MKFSASSVWGNSLKVQSTPKSYGGVDCGGKLWIRLKNRQRNGDKQNRAGMERLGFSE